MRSNPLKMVPNNFKSPTLFDAPPVRPPVPTFGVSGNGSPTPPGTAEGDQSSSSADRNTIPPGPKPVKVPKAKTPLQEAKSATRLPLGKGFGSIYIYICCCLIKYPRLWLLLQRASWRPKAIWHH